MTDAAFLPAGKLPGADLASVLTRIERGDGVLVGPRLGEDAAVLDLGDRCLVVTTDPITFATDRIGWYAVHVNANDVAVMGARPRWFFCVLMLPERSASRAMVDSIMDDVQRTCREVGASVCGGHTEITTQLERPIVVGQMLGEVARDRLVDKRQVEAGDRLLLTQGVAIEGTALLAREAGGRFRARLPPGTLERAREFLFRPGISIVSCALEAAGTGGIRAMHDPTEGGVLTGVAELAAAAGLGARIVESRIRVFPETRALCDAAGLDPLALIASGALLIAAPPARAGEVSRAVEALGIPVADVGEMRPGPEGLSIERNGRVEPFAPPARDEIARFFESDLAQS